MNDKFVDTASELQRFTDFTIWLLIVSACRQVVALS